MFKKKLMKYLIEILTQNCRRHGNGFNDIYIVENYNQKNLMKCLYKKLTQKSNSAGHRNFALFSSDLHLFNFQQS